jgi:hypothetical protein
MGQYNVHIKVSLKTLSKHIVLKERRAFFLFLASASISGINCDDKLYCTGGTRKEDEALFNHRVPRVVMTTFPVVHAIMMVKSAQHSEGGGCTPSPFHFIYHHKQSCGVRHRVPTEWQWLLSGVHSTVS